MVTTLLGVVYGIGPIVASLAVRSGFSLLGALQPTDWEALARMSNEPVGLTWRAWARERGAY